MEQTIREIIGRVRPDIDFTDVPATTNFDNAGLDSLDHASILFEVQDRYSVSIPDDLVDRLKSIESIMRYLIDNPVEG